MEGKCKQVQGKCKQGKGKWHASTDSKPNIPLQDNSLQWKWVGLDYEADLNFNCVDLCL